MKAVICGAGIAGLTAAHQLATLGWDVTLLEQAPAPRTQGYMIDFFGAGYDAAERMGVLPNLAALGYRVDELRYHDDTGRTRARLSYRRIADALDGRVFSIMRPDLEAALRAALPSGVRQLFGTSVRSVDDRGDGVEVTTTEGPRLDADVLVGADGVHSRVRGLVFGPERDHVRHLGFHTAAFTFRDGAVRDQVGEGVCLTESVDRQLGLYGLRDGRVAVFAVHREAAAALPDSPGEAVRAAYAGLGWVAPRVLSHVPADDRLYYDQVAQVVVPSWRRGRVVLVGDAAYAVSLLAGQGASLAVAGAFVLADRLGKAESVEDGLDEYEQAFRPVAEEKQRVAVKAVSWFLPHSRTQVWVRRAALTLARIPVFTRYVAAAVTGKASGLLRESPRKAVTDRKPTGLLRLALRAPIWLYRAGLGRVFGHRLVYLAHRGRRTGARREVVVEAVAYDGARPSVTVVAAWGKNPDWYRNLLAAPAVEVRVGAHRWHAPDHRRRTAAEVQETLRAYQHAHPRAWRRLAPLLGFPATPDDPRWPAVAREVRAIEFTPR